jgi:hypothetical protein
MSHMNRSQSGVSSSLLSTKDMFSGELTSNTNKTGVGVLFQLDSEGRVIVKTIVGGGAADRTRGTGSHEVRVGDFITRVDSRDVEREPMTVLKELILGPQGTQVTLTFGRRADDGIEFYEVRLMRGTAEYFNSLDASLRKQTELESLRAQIRDASTVELKDREDNERLKKQLAAEREISSRRERDFEAQRSEWDDEIARLQDSLRKVEAFRRENESKLQPIKLQEEELSDELARQKERDALRKSYIEEMKLRHEQTKTELMQQLTREQALHKEDQSARATCEAQLQTMDAELHDVRKLEADRRERDNQFYQVHEAQRKLVESLVLHEEAVRKGMVELDAKMSQFLVEYFLPESDNSYAGSARGQSFQQSSPSLYQQQQQQQIPSTKNVAPQRPIMQQPVRSASPPSRSNMPSSGQSAQVQKQAAPSITKPANGPVPARAAMSRQQQPHEDDADQEEFFMA